MLNPKPAASNDDYDYDLKIVLTRNTNSDDDEDYVPPEVIDDSTISLDKDDEDCYSSDDDDEETVTETDNNNTNTMEDSFSTSSETAKEKNATMIDDKNISTMEDSFSTSSAESKVKEEKRNASTNCSSTSDEDYHCINLENAMEHAASGDDERVGPASSASSSSSHQSSSYHFLFSNHSDFTLPDLDKNCSNAALLARLSCSEDEDEEKHQDHWFHSNTKDDGFSLNSSNNRDFTDFYPRHPESSLISSPDDLSTTAADGRKNVQITLESHPLPTENAFDGEKTNNKIKTQRALKHPTAISVTSNGQQSEPPNFFSSTDGSANSIINVQQQPPPTNFSSSSTDKSKELNNLTSSSTQTSPFHSLLLPNSDTTQSTSAFVEPTFKWKINGEPIGRGSFGTVHLGIDYTTGTLMAVKSIEIPSDIYYKDGVNNDEFSPAAMLDFQREINVLRSLSHENIVRYLGSEVSSSDDGNNLGGMTTFYIFQEWVPGGSLAGLLKKFGPLSTPIIQRYLMQILRGLAYLNEHRIIHRDIKGGNILVDDRGVVKLADFGATKQGISSTYKGVIAARTKNPASPAGNSITSPGSACSFETEDSQDMEQTLRGTPYFMAPEVYTEKYGTKCDIWSVGGVMYQMVTVNPPWKSLDHKNPIALLLHLKSTVGCPPPFDSNCTTFSDHQLCHPEVHQIMELCFQRNPKDRPSARRLLRHAFFTRSSFDDDVDTNIAAPVEKIMSRVPNSRASKSTMPIIEQLLKTIT
mmetsp:Transcript_16592/g.23650  ORF Transcript_16592/g.23650 Transcript_16592/m.23650 type:complete len:754 (-) Transcript_16592:366-2627(-)